MNIIIREATIDDAIEINHINTNGLSHDYPLDKTEIQLIKILASPFYKIFVAELNSIVVGYIHIGDYECSYSESFKDILSIAVMPQHQGKGIGKALLTTGENWAKECGSCGVRLVSSFQREGAHKFYAACGYTSNKNQKNFHKLF